MTERRRERGFRGEKTNSDEATKMTEGFFRDQQTFFNSTVFSISYCSGSGSSRFEKKFDKRI